MLIIVLLKQTESRRGVSGFVSVKAKGVVADKFYNGECSSNNQAAPHGKRPDGIERIETTTPTCRLLVFSYTWS